MTKPVERVFRMVMFLTILLNSTFPSFYYILPMNTKSSFYFFVIILSTGILTLLHATLCLCYRGVIKLKEFKNLELGSESRTCNVCMQYKPERSHHCSSCQGCIKKMDHHCHWLGRCINYDNHGFFVKFLFFMFVNSVSILLINIYYSYNLIWTKEYEIDYTNASILVLSMIASGLLGGVGLFHLINQISMVLLNITYIESLNCYNYGYSETDSPYSLSLKHNIETVFGSFKFLLLFKPTGDGIFFKKKYDVHYWPKHFNSKACSEIFV